MMEGNRVEVSGDLSYDYFTIRDSSVRGDKPDISAFAVGSDSAASIMLWNYHDVNILRPLTGVNLVITGIPVKKATMVQYRIDQENSNSYEAWKRMGSPQNPSPQQYSELEKAGALKMTEGPVKIKVREGSVSIPVSLPGQAVFLIKLYWE